MLKSSPKLTPQLLQLESRDVPATFYVDPLLAAAPDNTQQTFNAGKANQFTGLYGASPATPNAKVFSSFTNAVQAAFNSAGADTILLANGTIPVDNVFGTVNIDDNLTITGSGTGVTTLKPTTNNATNQDAVLQVDPGFSLKASQFTFDGAGKMVGNGFALNAATGLFNNVDIKNTSFDAQNGNGISAYNGSAFLFKDGSVSGYRRIGLQYQDSLGTVDNATITGLGLYAAAQVPNYGVQINGGSNVEVFGSLIKDNRVADDFGFLSFGVFLYQDLGLSPNAKITRTQFDNNSTGVTVGAARGADGSVATINFNNFFKTNIIGVEAVNNTTVNAKQNYWGDYTGPSKQFAVNPNGIGTGVDDQVDFRAFLHNPFQKPVPSETVFTTDNPGGPVYLLNSSFAVLSSYVPFGGTSKGENSVSAGDVNGDGVNDIIVGSGPGIASTVEIADGRTGAFLRSFSPYGAYTGGVNVASGDFNNDGKADIVVTTRSGTLPQVRIFDGATVTGNAPLPIQQYLAYTASFTAGVNVAVGDVNNDGFPDVIVGAATGGAPQVRVFSGQNGNLLQDFYGFQGTGPNAFLGGVNVTAGDLNGDGRADILVSPMTGGTQIRGFQTNLDGTMSVDAQSRPIFVPVQFFATVSSNNGVYVAARDLDGDGFSDLLYTNRFGAGSDSKFRVVYNPSLGAAVPTTLTSGYSLSQNGSWGVRLG